MKLSIITCSYNNENMNLNVLTSNNSGAFKSEWFNYYGHKLINYLKINSDKNIKLIRQCIL